jgi:ABC-type branched-subunit amino acid transport system ATPase component
MTDVTGRVNVGGAAAAGPDTPLLRVANVETAYYGRLTVLRVSLTPAGQVVACWDRPGGEHAVATILGFNQPEKGMIGPWPGSTVGPRISPPGVAYILKRGIFQLIIEENLRQAYRRRDGSVGTISYLETQFRSQRDARNSGTLSGGEQQMLALAVPPWRGRSCSSTAVARTWCRGSW